MACHSSTRFWGQGDDEVLTHYDPHEAIEAILDVFFPDLITEITVFEYKPMTPTVACCGHPLEMVLEQLDEEYGNPDFGTDATQAMRDAEQVFLRAVLAEYRSWACERTGECLTVDAVEWTREHRPDWLKSPAPEGQTNE